MHHIPEPTVVGSMDPGSDSDSDWDLAIRPARNSKTEQTITAEIHANDEMAEHDGEAMIVPKDDNKNNMLQNLLNTDDRISEKLTERNNERRSSEERDETESMAKLEESIRPYAKSAINSIALAVEHRLHKVEATKKGQNDENASNESLNGNETCSKSNLSYSDTSTTKRIIEYGERVK